MGEREKKQGDGVNMTKIYTCRTHVLCVMIHGCIINKAGQMAADKGACHELTPTVVL